ncbi:MAG: hypothetical protein M1299_01430 [Firmicutes bacterium]|nr:hypothetical protein [Bacillota bacterium]MCL5038486.1 hypothetical protein [Bacillota bacterium]
MTHSLHRFGERDSLRGDFVWLSYQTKGINDRDLTPIMQEIVAIAEKAGSVNWGDIKTGSILAVQPEEIKTRLKDSSRIRGVFTSRQQVVNFLEAMKEKDFGQSVVISGLLEEVLPACQEAGVIPHTVNFALGIWGRKELLPEEDILAVTSMCGHHMISPNLVRTLRERVRAGRISADKAARALGRLCPCGIFNQERARRLLEG